MVENDIECSYATIHELVYDICKSSSIYFYAELIGDCYYFESRCEIHKIRSFREIERSEWVIKQILIE